MKTELEVRTPCGHKNAAKPNIYPFDLWVCLDCESRFKDAQLKVIA